MKEGLDLDWGSFRNLGWNQNFCGFDDTLMPTLCVNSLSLRLRNGFFMLISLQEWDQGFLPVGAK